MNISKIERRVLNALALGGYIAVQKDENGQIETLDCITREGWFLDGFDTALFRKLKAKRLILSRNGGPYRISRRGIEALQFARSA